MAHSVHFVDNTFVCNVTTTATKMQLLGGDEAAVQLEIIDLQQNTALQHGQNDCTPTEFWVKCSWRTVSWKCQVLQDCADYVRKHMCAKLDFQPCHAWLMIVNIVSKLTYTLSIRRETPWLMNTWKIYWGQQSLSISLRSKEMLQHSRVEFLTDILWQNSSNIS